MTMPADPAPADPLAGAKWRVDQGDSLELLRGLPEGCVNCVVTSLDNLSQDRV